MRDVHHQRQLRHPHDGWGLGLSPQEVLRQSHMLQRLRWHGQLHRILVCVPLRARSSHIVIVWVRGRDWGQWDLSDSGRNNLLRVRGHVEWLLVFVAEQVFDGRHVLRQLVLRWVRVNPRKLPRQPWHLGELWNV